MPPDEATKFLFDARQACISIQQFVKGKSLVGAPFRFAGNLAMNKLMVCGIVVCTLALIVACGNGPPAAPRNAAAPGNTDDVNKAGPSPDECAEHLKTAVPVSLKELAADAGKFSGKWLLVEGEVAESSSYYHWVT